MKITLRGRWVALPLAVLLCGCAQGGAAPPPRAATPATIAAAPQNPVAADTAAVHAMLEAEKRSIVAQYMQLNASEAEKFWPVYEAYQADLQKVHALLRDLLEDYAADYRDDSVTDAKAQALLERWLAVERDDAALRGSYAPRVMQALPAKKAARYLQIENEYRIAMRYDLAAMVPLMP